MNRKLVILAAVIVSMLSACRRQESSLTGSYGQRMVSGEVVMATGTPAGVAVSVAGTGMTLTLEADGRFTFVGVPEDVELTFRRADGIDARLRTGATHSLVVELSGNSARGSSRRRGASQTREIEGVIVAASSDSITIKDSKGNEVKVAITSSTLIRGENGTLTVTDLKVDDRVEVKAAMKDNTLTALSIKVENEENEHENEKQEIEGVIVSASADSLTILDSHKTEVTVALTPLTVIRKGNQTLTAADLKKDDRVHVKATTINNVLTAFLVIVQQQAGDDGHGGGNTEMDVKGVVKSVAADSLVVLTTRGEVSVKTDANTIVEVKDRKASLSDIKAGDLVEAEGTRVDDKTLMAKKIEVRRK